MQDDDLNLDETVLRVDSEDPGAVTCTRSDYTFSIIGYRLERTKVNPADDYYTLLQSFFTLAKPDAVTTQLQFRPTKQMWPGLHEIVIEARYKGYTRQGIFVPKTTLLYYDRQYDNECRVDLGQTQTKFNQFMASNPFSTVQLTLGDNGAYSEGKYGPLLTTSYFIQPDRLPGCPIPQIGIMLEQ